MRTDDNCKNCFLLEYSLKQYLFFHCQTAVRNTLGYIRSSSVCEIVSSFKQPAITRPSLNKPIASSGQDSNLNSFNVLRHNATVGHPILEMSQTKLLDNNVDTLHSAFNNGGILSYEKWSSAGGDGTISQLPGIILKK